ncbi:copper amine oxidase [Planococcus halotolerans]|uniref:Copper amine oxidase n=1 Tax=Planococcus halotolerans TaxID=2233542 RepID=A0A365KUF3_9BACL|nr:copper amine oxidase [Planococcus halotolerans]QHJ71341.1 copper amine oxidase [Planococcus halotolerans]RAZ76803.1 copper amine oxidase [Planococcus halotolerans]
MKRKNKVVAVLLSLVLLVPVGGGAVLAVNHGGPTVDTAAVELRSNTDHLFTEHAYLIITAMRKSNNGDPDAAQAEAAVINNGKDLQAAIASLYGEDAGAEFIKNWTDHIGYFMDYANAVSAGDMEAKQTALDNLANYTHLSGKFQEKLTEGRVMEAAVVNVLSTHIDQITGSYDAYVSGDYQQAYTIQSEAMEHLLNNVSKTLSDAYTQQFPEMFNDTKAVTKAADLRSNLSFLLAEHFALLQQSMQNGFEQSEEYDANLALLNENTEQLAAAIASVYGEEAGAQFNETWSNHIDYFMEYVMGTVNESQEEKEAALAELDQYRADFSEFMSGATEGRVEASALSEGLQMHVNQAIGTFNSYVEGDYEQTWTTAREGYKHMFTPGKLLSSAIVQQFPEQFAGLPEMPETGMGGMADSGNLNWMLWTLPLLVLVGVLAVNRRKVLQ